MLTELCGYLRNYFDRDRILGDFIIQSGTIVPSNTMGELTLLDGAYIRIVGSVLNDGVWLYKSTGVEGLRDESFNGAVWILAIPQAVVDISKEITAWQAKYGGADSAAMSPFNSESFGGYSYSKGASGTNGEGAGWVSAFGSRLSQWRKI